MRLVTFRKDSGPPHAGALVDDDSRVVDLAKAHQAAFGGPGFDSVLRSLREATPHSSAPTRR
jgi:hypothetical protein